MNSTFGVECSTFLVGFLSFSFLAAEANGAELRALLGKVKIYIFLVGGGMGERVSGCHNRGDCNYRSSRVVAAIFLFLRN